MSKAGEVLFDSLAKKNEEKQVAAWQAMSAVVNRHQLPALKFAAHYAPFATLIPASGSDVLDPMTLRFLTALEALTAAQCEALAHRLRIEPAASRALLEALGPFGRTTVGVAGFVKGANELAPIQGRGVRDRGKLVAGVTRDSSAEPAGVVRSILATIEGTKSLDTFTRCRAFAAVERAGYAVESNGKLSTDQVAEMYAPFAQSIPFGYVNGSGFAHQLAALSKDDWRKVAADAPPANEEAVAPLVNAGTALIDFFGGRSDDKAVAAWHAVSALVRRPHLTPIKFAASYAPFASAIPVTSPRALGAMVSRYVTALGRLGAAQCTVLAKQSEVDQDAASALSKATVDGSARSAEEAAALAAVVSVPMRVAGSVGWAAVKTAAYGGKVIASRARLTQEQLEALWKPIEPAVPLASLGAPTKVRR